MLRAIFLSALVLELSACTHRVGEPDYGALHPTYVAFFGTNSADLTPDGYAIVQRAAKGVDTVHPQTVQIVGFSDRVGSEAADNNIAERRTEVVEKTLIELGVPGSIITAVQLGQPADELGPTANRRVEIHLIKDYSIPSTAGTPNTR